MNTDRRDKILAAIRSESEWLEDAALSVAIANGIEAGLYYAPFDTSAFGPDDGEPVRVTYTRANIPATRAGVDGFQAGVDWIRGQLLEQIAGLRASAVRLDHLFGDDDEAADRVLEFVEKRIEDLGVRW